MLEEQVGFVLRQASQRHATPVRGAHGRRHDADAMGGARRNCMRSGRRRKICLGRLTAMDVATIKGVVDRLMKRGFVRSAADETDARRRLLTLSDAGRAFVEANFRRAHAITRDTLAPLTERERAIFVALLEKLK